MDTKEGTFTTFDAVFAQGRLDLLKQGIGKYRIEVSGPGRLLRPEYQHYPAYARKLGMGFVSGSLWAAIIWAGYVFLSCTLEYAR